ncbi:LysR family transcriptional regulator [Pseudomonas alkylphenolica]|uniref:LysR family transcriptional regulator n=1 Tax=Pseudomonas alkylphenolica TaxID=237609 RepID=A0A443ZT29_9PSED|nr:LysR family transcriptional regulator [Pseudomonas alkylphenolica]RWU22866.1 LysR family transcriptional regulator [Pseudomonas alkylphenolica]
MDTLGAISMFVATADQGSFSRAAEMLGKTPSALTKAVSMLEKQLGTLLFERSTRRIVLTESGRLYLETARQVLRSLHEAGEEISQLHQGLSGTLRMTAPLAFERAFLGEVCAGFLEEYPDIQLRVELSDDFVDLIEAGYDLGIRQGRSDLPGLIARVVGQNRIFLCASPEYVARNPLPLSPHTCNQHDWLKYLHPALDMKFWWVQSEAGRIRLPYPQRVRLESDSYDLLLQNALAGRGILHTPQWSVDRYLRDGRLVRLMEDYVIGPEAFGDDILAVYPSHRRASRKVLAFVDYLQTHLSHLNSA